MLQHVTGRTTLRQSACVSATLAGLFTVCIASAADVKPQTPAVKKASQTAAPTDKCQLAAQAAWARGVEGQRRADLGSGCFLNPIFAGDHPDPSILKDGTDYYMTFSSFDALPGRTFAGSIIQFNPSADLQSRQFMARVILSNKDDLFKPGMFAHVKLETERVKGAICVPREAIQSDKLGQCVFIVENGKAKRESVTTGVSDESFTAVEGLIPGTKVVTLSAYPVRDGMKLITGGKGKGPGGAGKWGKP